MDKLLNTLWGGDHGADSKVEFRPSATALGRLPQFWPMNRFEGPTSTALKSHTKKANKFLIHQEKRILFAISEGKYERAAFIWMLLLKRSVSYQLVLLNRTVKPWYFKYSVTDVHKLFMELRRHCMKWDLEMVLQRVYLDKGMEKYGIPNGKLRPIGAPTLVSKMISKAVTDMVYYIHRSELKSWQHGYRLEQGCFSALYQVWQHIFVDKKEYIYEFDFRSFFNTVPHEYVKEALLRRSELLCNLALSLIRNVRYIFNKLEKESELVIMPKLEFPKEHNLNKAEISNRREAIEKSQNFTKKLPIILRNGVPQGLPISPLLATLALEVTSTPKNLVMYADDGLIFGDNEDERNKWFEELEFNGISTASEKTGRVENEFRFLGTDWNIKERWVKYENHILKWSKEEESILNDHKRIRSWFKRVASVYGAKPTEWTWEIDKNSWIMRFPINLRSDPVKYLLVLTHSYLSAVRETFGFKEKDWDPTKAYTGYKFFPSVNKIFSISASSSKCCADFLRQWKQLNLPKEMVKETLRKSVEKIKLSKGQQRKLEKLMDSPVLYEAVLDDMANKQREKRRPKINKLGRSHIRSNAHKVIINGDLLKRYEFVIFSKYVEQRNAVLTPFKIIW